MVSGFRPIEQGFGGTAEQLLAAAVLVAACDQLTRQTEVFCTACCELGGHTSQLDEYLKGKLAVVAKCKQDHPHCFASPVGIHVDDAPTITNLAETMAGDSWAPVGPANNNVGTPAPPPLLLIVG